VLLRNAIRHTLCRQPQNCADEKHHGPGGHGGLSGGFGMCRATILQGSTLKDSALFVS
jgi:hypothetical protein